MADQHDRAGEDQGLPQGGRQEQPAVSSAEGAAAQQNASSQQPEQVITPEGEVEIRYPDGRIEHPAVQHEPRDVRFGCVLALILGACCFAAVHYFVIWRYFWNRADAQAEMKKSPYPLAPTPSTQLPPEPRLEQIDRMSRDEASNVYYRQLAKEKLLNSYGPTEEKGFVHIPIQQAIDAVAQEAQAGKLPERNQPP